MVDVDRYWRLTSKAVIPIRDLGFRLVRAQVVGLHCRVGAHLVGWAFTYHLPVVEYGDAVSQFEHHIHVVLDNQEGQRAR